MNKKTDTNVLSTKQTDTNTDNGTVLHTFYKQAKTQRICALLAKMQDLVEGQQLVPVMICKHAADKRIFSETNLQNDGLRTVKLPVVNLSVVFRGIHL